MKSRSRSSFSIVCLLACGITAQVCATVADGCDAGTLHESGMRSAISRFKDGVYYGGGEQIVMSSSVDGSALAMLTYLCNDGSVPPRLEGSIVRSSAEKILSCPNQCGGISAPDSDKCGFGILVANNAAGNNCFSKAVNVVPQGTAPVVKQTANAFRNPLCMVDAPNSRVLANGSSVDYSAKGMTVEKCADLAGTDVWRYAGLEFGGECYWGDDLISIQQSNQADCNVACAGDTSEVCGGSNRILVYENGDWQLLTRPELADECNQYLDVLAQMKSELDQWNDLLLQYQNLLKSQPGGRRKIRQRETDIQKIFREILETREAILNRKAQLEDLEKSIQKLFDIAIRKSRVKPTEVELLVRKIAEPVTQVGESVAGTAAMILEVGASAEAAVEVATSAITVVGAPKITTQAGVIVATGIFAVLGALIGSLSDSTSTPEGPTTVFSQAPTSTRTSTSSSSTCTTCATCLDNRAPNGPDLDQPEKRSGLVDFEGSNVTWVESTRLERRVLDRSYSVCNGLQWSVQNIIPYPPAFSERNGRSSDLDAICPPDGSNPDEVSDCVPGITKYLYFDVVRDYEPGATPAGITSQFCGWKMVQNDAREISEDYSQTHWATEHVLELHFLQTFLRWLVDQNTWAVLTPGVTVMDCNKLSNILFTNGQYNNHLVGIFQSWTWYDIQTGNPAGRETELFILESTINGLKNRIFNANADIGSIILASQAPVGLDPVRKATWYHAQLRLASVAFEYMNDPLVRTAFVNAHNRIMAAWDTEMNAFFANANNAQYDFAANNLFTGPNRFSNAWRYWMITFVNAKTAATQAWKNQMLAELRTVTQGAGEFLRNEGEWFTDHIADPNPLPTNPLKKLTDAFMSLRGYQL